MSTEIILRERDRERRVGGQVEFGITLAPVSVLMRGWLVSGSVVDVFGQSSLS